VKKLLNKAKKRAILLITTLIFSVLLMIGVFISMSLSGQSLFRSENAEDSLAANGAVRAGAQYALARLQERPSWKGDGDGTTTSLTTIDQVDLVVVEDNGDVVGFLTTEGGTPAQFRIRFNFHDGDIGSTDDADGLNDPVTLQIGGPWISLNNLMNSSSNPVPRAELVSSGWTVQPSSPMPYDAPIYTACILVEGRAGEALRDQTTNGLNPDPAPNGQTMATRFGEFYFRRQVAATTDAVSYSAGNLDVTLADDGIFKMDTADSGDIAKIRSNENVSIQSTGGSVTYDASDSEVYVRSVDGSFELDGTESTSPVATQRTTPKGEFFELEWGEIKKADSAGAEVKAGTYIWRDDLTGAYLEYYAEDYLPSGVYAPGAGTRISDVSGLIDSGPTSSITMDPSELRLQYNGDVNVVSQGPTVNGFAVVPETSITTSGRRPVNELVSTATESPILTAPGDISFQGRLYGAGSVTAEGNITFQGSSTFESGANELAIYSKKDINLEAIPHDVVVYQAQFVVPPTVTTTGSGGPSSFTTTTAGSGGPPLIGFLTREFQDQEFEGVIFAMGDFHADLGGPSYRGNLALQGVIAAYGGDPEAGESPGASGKGYITVNANDMALIYDPGHIENILDLNAPTPLITTFATIR
jgi:hypothetical protein